ncbi:hypothetical protein H0H92_000253, partial [Tricholoma furcatifolium]
MIHAPQANDLSQGQILPEFRTERGDVDVDIEQRTLALNSDFLRETLYFAPQGYASHLKACSLSLEALAINEAIEQRVEAQEDKAHWLKPEAAGSSRKGPRLELSASKGNQAQLTTTTGQSDATRQRNVPRAPRLERTRSDKGK